MFLGNEIVLKVIMNTLLVSIPEEIFVVLFTYILMGEFDQWNDKDCKKLFQSGDYARILVPAITTALISNILRYNSAPSGIITLVMLNTIILGIVVMGDIYNNARAVKWILEVTLYVLFAVIVIAVIEFMYIPFFVYGIDKPLAEINNSIWNNFLLSAPGTIIEYIILAFLVARKRSLLQARIIKIIVDSKVLTAFSLVICAIDFTFFWLMIKLVCYEKVLINFSLELRMLTIILICLFPILNISALICCTYYVKNGEAKGKREAAERIIQIADDITRYMKKGKYEDINWALNSVNENLRGLATSFFVDENKKTRG